MLRASSAVPELREIESPDLLAFALDYFAGDRARISPPLDNLLFDKGVTSIVLHREGRFQVELVVVEPMVTIPEHVHDDVDSLEVAISGQIDLHVDGKQVGFMRTPRADGRSRDLLRYVPIRRDAWHGARTAGMGATFISVQLWHGKPPTHVGLNWRGPSLGRRINA